MIENDRTKQWLTLQSARTYAAIFVGWYTFGSLLCWVGIIAALIAPGNDTTALIVAVRGVIAAVLLHRFSQLRVRAQQAYRRSDRIICRLSRGDSP